MIIIELFIEWISTIYSIVMGWILGVWYAIVRYEQKCVEFIKNLFKRK